MRSLQDWNHCSPAGSVHPCDWGGCAICTLWFSCRQLDFGAVIRQLSDSGYDDDKVEALDSHFGHDTKTVTVEQLAAAGIPNRTLLELRRNLSPRPGAGLVTPAAEVRRELRLGTPRSAVTICIVVLSSLSALLLTSRLEHDGVTLLTGRLRPFLSKTSARTL